MDVTAFERSVAEGHDLMFLESVPYIIHCHHYNLFHDQTLEDAVGEEEAIAIRTRAAHAAFRPLLERVFERVGAATSLERLQLASTLFGWMGHGRLTIEATAEGGTAQGEHLHYGHCWHAKYGAVVKRSHPADAVAAGFCAAAVEVTFDLRPGSMAAVETACAALRSQACSFEIKPAIGEAPVLPVVLRDDYMKHAKPTFASKDEARIDQIAKGLQKFMRGVGGNEHGLIPAFGVHVTMHLPTFYNLSGYEIVHHVEKMNPANRAVAEQLIREAGRVCVFNTYGNILLSPEWEGLVGKPGGDPLDMVSYCCAISRGLGFGHWSLAELDPGKRLVLRAPATYEAPFYLSHYGVSEVPRCYIFQGAALGIMLLAQEVDWASQPNLTNEMYQKLIRSGRAPWKVEETKCIGRGDDVCEAVVSLP